MIAGVIRPYWAWVVFVRAEMGLGFKGLLGGLGLWRGQEG